MKRCRILRSGVVSQQIDGKTYERKKGEVIEVTEEALAHLVATGNAELAEEELLADDPKPARKRAER